MGEVLEVQICFDDFSDKTTKTIANFSKELNSLRVGRANIHILDKVRVNYYGVLTPINQVGNITIPEARVLMINIWDNSIIKDVEKAIIDANIGIFPVNDGKVLRLVFPELNEERRKTLSKEVKTMGENTKITIRNARRDSIEKLRKYKKDSIITEDDLIFHEKECDRKTATLISQIDDIVKNKVEEIMEI